MGYKTKHKQPKTRDPIARAAWDHPGAGSHKTIKDYDRSRCECGLLLNKHNYCDTCDGELDEQAKREEDSND